MAKIKGSCNVAGIGIWDCSCQENGEGKKRLYGEKSNTVQIHETQCIYKKTAKSSKKNIGKQEFEKVYKKMQSGSNLERLLTQSVGLIYYLIALSYRSFYSLWYRFSIFEGKVSCCCISCRFSSCRQLTWHLSCVAEEVSGKRLAKEGAGRGRMVFKED